jgi:hypothetical protein
MLSFLPRICYSSRDERGLESQIQSHHLSQSIIIIIIIFFKKEDDFINRNAFSEKKERKIFLGKDLAENIKGAGTIVHWTCAHSRRREVAWPRWSSSLYFTTMVPKATPLHYISKLYL